MIPKYRDETKFRRLLGQHLTPAQPISNLHHLYGRERHVREISRALASPGRHVFILGDRGIGKTSLAKTSACHHLNVEAASIPFVSCDHSVSFFDLASGLCKEIMRVNPKLHKNLRVAGEINVGFFKLSVAQDTTRSGAPFANVHEVCETLRMLTTGMQQPCLVIVDEFDQLLQATDKKFFADFIKQLSDRNLPIHLIITGIGRSLEELIGVHLSTDRYLAPVPLESISHDARWKILETAMSAAGLEMDKNHMIRIGQISDGFPYYVHLVGEQVMWAAFDSPEDVVRIGPETYAEGIRQAIEATTTSLKQAYDIATMKHQNSEDYEHALWAIADGPMLMKQVSEIYTKSYLKICKDLGKAPPLTKEKFYQRLNMLKRPSHGSIIHANKQGWYQFSENVVRGYVRLRAERAGVSVGVDSFTGT